MGREVCIITGVGPGTGSALARRFSDRYDVAMIARDEGRLKSLAEELNGARAFVCDVTDTERLKATVDRIRSEMGIPRMLVHNAVGGSIGDVLTADPSHLELNFKINTMALLHLVQAVAQGMIDAGGGSILATGNTAAYRGKAHVPTFAPSKAAQRILLESAARHLGPLGVHVAYVAIDAVIDVPWTRAFFAGKPDEFFSQPSDIAEECFHVAHQPRSTWSFDVVIRPFGEQW